MADLARLYVGIKDYYEKQPPTVREFTLTNRSTQPELLNIHSAKVQECASIDGTYSDIQTIKIDARNTNYLEIDQYSDLAYWFKVIFIKDPADPDDPSGELIETPPLVIETIGHIIDKIKEEIGDLDEDNPAFTDEEYLRRIRVSLRRYKGERNLSYIDEGDIPIVALLTRIDTCHVIAYDHAKYYALTSPSATLDKSQIMSHYLEVAKALEAYWEKIKDDLGLSGGGINDEGIISEFPSPNVGTMSRFSTRAARVIDNINPIRRRWAKRWF